jgi:hypothetical protein
MEYNLAKLKMKKKLLFIALSVFLLAGINSFAAQKNDNNQQLTITNNGNCISGNFIAREDGRIVGSLLLRSDCTFRMVERDGYDVTTTDGTYSIEGNISRGQMADIEFFVNGRSQGTARLAWPEEEGLCIFINGYIFRKE